MHRNRPFLTPGLATGVVALVSVAFVGCSSDDSAVTARRSNSTAIAYPTDPEVALLWLGDGYTAPELVIGGDGWVYAPSGQPVDAPPTTPAGFVQTAGHAPAAIPAPPAPTPFERRRLTEEGIQIVLAQAKDKGLLQEQQYEVPGITDSPTTTLTVTDSTGTYEHSAYALGYDHETGNRKDLFDFVQDVNDLVGLVGDDNIGPAESYVPATYSVSINGSFYAGDPIDWPDGVPVTDGCIDLPIDRFAPGVAGLYIAEVNGENTRVAVVPDLPGDGCT
jgi:hypothetical protein